MKLRTISISFIAFCILSFLAASCITKSSYDDQTISFSRISASRHYTLTGSAEYFGTEKDLLFSDSVSLLVPMLVENIDVRPLQDSIFKLAFDTTGVDHSAIIDSYFSEISSDLGFPVSVCDTSANAYNADGFEVIRGVITNLSPDILVYCVINECMMPRAAHGMTVKNYINYLTDTGKIITLSDIFTTEGISDLPAIIAKRAADRVAILGPTEIDSLPTNGNFYISPSREIVFSYQPYEVASFAQGAINIAFYPYELISYMTPEAVKYFGLTDMLR